MKFFDYKENKQRGTFDFPIEFYHVSPGHPRYTMPYHWHTEYEMIRILEGELSLVISDINILGKAGDILFMQDGVFHAAIPNNCVYECIVFDIKLLLKENNICTKQIQDIINKKKIINYKFPNNIPSLKSCCDNLFESMKSTEMGHEFITQGALYTLLGLILSNELYEKTNNNHKNNSKRLSQFKNVMTLIENEYSTPLTLDDLAKACYMTPKYFCRFFFEMTNKTPIEYLNYYRIECACEQLLTNDLPITEIAFNCGFNDTSYFIKTFKKYKGVTPKQYLKSSSK